MNKKLKELARQAKPSPNLIWEDSDLERFAELVRDEERKGCAEHYLGIMRDAVKSAKLAKPEQDPIAYVSGYYNGRCVITPLNPALIMPSGIALYTAPPRKPWVGLTNEDWENTPNTGKVGCERDAELFDWIEQTLKDKNDTL